jgi:hypothetical protein
VQSSLRLCQEISAQRRLHRTVDIDLQLVRREGHNELIPIKLFADQVHRQYRVEETWFESDKPCEWRPLAKCYSQAFVLGLAALVAAARTASSSSGPATR